MVLQTQESASINLYQETGFSVRLCLSSKTSLLPYVCISPAAGLIRDFLFLLHNVLQVCHGGHSLGVIYVTPQQHRSRGEPRNAGWRSREEGGEGKHHTWSSVISSPHWKAWFPNFLFCSGTFLLFLHSGERGKLGTHT